MVNIGTQHDYCTTGITREKDIVSINSDYIALTIIIKWNL